MPDGTHIVFAADTHGSYDVFSVRADGQGEATRLTWHSRDEVPLGVSPDGARLLVRSGRLDVGVNPAVYPFPLDEGEDDRRRARWAGVFEMPVGGGMPRPLVEPSAFEAAWDSSGKRLLFSVRPGTETVERKHERSPAARDIWLQLDDGSTLQKLTTFDGNDAAPVWGPQDGSVYYLSERSGTFNVWRMRDSGDANAQQVTRHELFPVRDLSVSRSGSFAYSYRGDLYVGTAQGEFRKLRLKIPKRAAREPPGILDLGGEVRDAALVPTRSDVVLVARGELHAVERSTGRHRGLLSAFPGLKSWPTFSADGRRLLAVRDAGDFSELLLAEVSDASGWADPRITPRVTSLIVIRDEVILRAALSPDGEQAAYTTGMSLRVVRRGEAPRQLLTREQGLEKDDEPIVWHPGGERLAIQWQNRRRQESEIAIVSAKDGTLVNFTQSGFQDVRPSWTRDGRALVWQSDRDGLRQFRPPRGTSDLYLKVIDPGTSQRVRLTRVSSNVEAGALAPSGAFSLTTRSGAQGSELWITPVDGSDERRLARLDGKAPSGFSSNDSIQFSADEREAFVLSGGRARWVALDGGTVTTVALADVAAASAAAEQRWVFEHIVRTVPRVFYRPELLGARHWPRHVEEYRRFLPAITDAGDFAELMSELLGELDSSHTFFRYEIPGPRQRSGSLGVLYDPDDRGPGWRIAAVLPGSPLERSGENVVAGDRITRVNDVPVTAGSDPAQALLDTSGTEIELSLESATRGAYRVRITALGNAAESALRYRRWVLENRKATERLSGGRLGYVHLSSMSEGPFRAMVDDVLGRFIDKEGIVVDTRFNQGGWMHGPMLEFFSAPFAFDLRANGTLYASEPAFRAGRPVVLLVNAANYSNGFETPVLMRERGIAKLVGESIAGSGLGGNGDPLPYWQFSYGVAHDATLSAAGIYWEGLTQAPDVAVDADRNALREGRDVQLEAAVKELLREIGP